MITEPKTIGHVGEMLSSTLSAEKQTNRQHLLKVAERVKFLARQAIPYRGNGDEDNFLQLMKLRAIDVPSITTYLQCKTDKYVSPQVQNELTIYDHGKSHFERYIYFNKQSKIFCFNGR